MNPLKKHSRGVGTPASDGRRRRVLVTGASGFLGSYVHELLAHAHEVVVTSARKATVDSVRALEPDVVVHLAAMTNADACEAEPDRAAQANVEVTRRLARGARDSCSLFLYASTDLVFDGERAPYSETDEPRPVGVYGNTKLEGERVARAELGERAVALRLALLYGRARGSGARQSFAETMVRRGRAGEKVELFEDQMRMPLYVEDASESIARLLVRAPNCPVIHLGGPERCSRYAMGRAAFEVFGIPDALAVASRMSSHRMNAPRPRDVSLNREIARELALPARGVREGFTAFRDRMDEPDQAGLQ
jgi:dTDP-4-dehydrorhamnose reductase